MQCVVFIPDSTGTTSVARANLPPDVPRKDVVFNIGRAAIFVNAFPPRNLDELRYATRDMLHQPQRGAAQYPHLELWVMTTLITPKTPEELLEESVVALGLPALEQDERSRGLQQRQLQLPTLSPHARSAGKSSSRGPTKHSHTYVQQLSRESARELAKTALSMRSTSIGDYTREPPQDTELNAVVRVDHHVRKCELRLDPDIITWSRGSKTLGVLPTDDVVGAELLAKKAASSFCVHYFKKDRGSGAKALRRTALTG
ncbi:hypothetical protein PR002_g17964 [Phytophthora rubi]|uniref:Uncharacterized protein n=1 Tax=Phytophthora rubi TaxID=129364 RepID=A0A6A3K6Q3_9STRA|nr:hypothetical protein PR002_g17964 [Phytophthora rubi]